MISHPIVQGRIPVISLYVLSLRGLPLALTCVVVTVNEARSYFASTVTVETGVTQRNDGSQGHQGTSNHGNNVNTRIIVTKATMVTKVTMIMITHVETMYSGTDYTFSYLYFIGRNKVKILINSNLKVIFMACCKAVVQVVHDFINNLHDTVDLENNGQRVLEKYIPLTAARYV
jgi:hypothetical protein